MDLHIFDVEHGQCALLRCDNNTDILIDCGHSRNLGWQPGDYLRSVGIASVETLFVTNYDEDHVSGLPNLMNYMTPLWMVRNPTVSPQILRSLKTEDGYGNGIDTLIDLMKTEGPSSPTNQPPIFEGLVWEAFHAPYPVFDDENNLSMAVFLKCHGIGVLFTGDLEVKGWRNLLCLPSFREILGQTNVLVASHHGRDSGCCDEVFNYCAPFYTVISDCGYKYDTQQTVPY